MALINCPVCGKEMSDMAEKCPSCGYTAQVVKKQGGSRTFGVGQVLYLIAGACMGFAPFLDYMVSTLVVFSDTGIYSYNMFEMMKEYSKSEYDTSGFIVLPGIIVFMGILAVILLVVDVYSKRISIKIKTIPILVTFLSWIVYWIWGLSYFRVVKKSMLEMCLSISDLGLKNSLSYTYYIGFYLIILSLILGIIALILQKKKG